MMKKNFAGWLPQIAIATGLVALGSSCLLQPIGDGSFDELDPDRHIVHSTPPQSPWVNAENPGNSVSQGAQSFDSDFDGDGVPDGPLAPPSEHDIRGVGYSRGVTITVRANQRLQLQFQAEAQQSTTTTGGLIPDYSALGVYLTVNGRSRPTPLLRVGDTSPVYDFSRETDCFGDELCTVRIRIEKPNYDLYCLLYPYGVRTTGGRWVYPCPSVGYSRVDERHRWYGKLIVSTDDNEPLDQ